MNTGLQDAYNLGWKLALVVNGEAAAALLDSYEEERLPVARRLLDTTDRAFRLVVSDSWLAGLFRTQILARIAAFAMSLEPIQRTAFRIVSQIGIQYRASRLSHSQDAPDEGAPRAGDRFPWLRLRLRPGGPTEDLFARLDDTQFNLILIGQAPPAGDLPGRAALVHVLVVPADPVNDREFARARIPQPSFYLLRPDGHIGFAGIRVDAAAVTEYLSQRLHMVVKRA